jgi:uncharacterized membrane protein
MNEMIEMCEEIVKNERFFQLSAEISKKTVDALVAQGFTRAEAVSMITNMKK